MIHPGDKIKKYFSRERIFFALLIGIALTLWLVLRNFDIEPYRQIEWKRSSLFWFLAAILLMIGRDLGYILRLRILSDKKLSFRQCLEISLLWEFASAISPSAIGGTAVALILMAQERLETGRTTAIVLITSFLDEVFFISMVPLVFLIVGVENVFPLLDPESIRTVVNTGSLKLLFWTGYSILFAWTVFLAVGILVNPKIARMFILGLFSFPLLRRWRRQSVVWGRDMVIAAQEFKHKSYKFWLKAYGATFLSWTSRYLVVNALLMMFSPVDDHILAYGRQLVMWVILLVSVTPGASGIAEIIFPAFMGDFLPDPQIANGVAVLWRFLSYYPYIIIGAFVLPIWLRRVSKERHQEAEDASSS